MKRYIKDDVIKFSNEVIIKELGSITEDGTQLYRYHLAKNEEEILNNGWVLYEDLDEIKQEKLQEITEYDKSSDVNSFFVNGVQAWIDRDTRASVAYSTNIRLRNGFENTTLWLNGVPFEIPCQLLIQLLDSLEIYALDCYNVTEQHKQNIMNLQKYNDVINYDFTVNYPEKLNITL